MEINKNYCRNIFISNRGKEQMLQIPSLYFQCNLWSARKMAEIMWDVATTSLKILEEEL